jgi:hypothetical protein
MRTSLSEVILSHIRKFSGQLYTSTPAIVEAYHPEDCTVDVYPAIFRPDKDGIDTREPFLERVPLHFQATQELGITYPVRKGDTVLLVFGMFDAENWLQSNKDFDFATTRRMHNINDAYAIAGVFKYNRSPVQSGTEQDLNIRYKDTFVRIKQNGDIEASSPTKISLSVGGNSTIVMDNNGITLNAPRIDLNPE